MIASLSAVVAALVVSHFWGAGTIAATAATPVIVARVAKASPSSIRLIFSTYFYKIRLAFTLSKCRFI